VPSTPYPSFEVAEAEAYRRDVPGAEVHVIDAGDFVLDEAPDLVADLLSRLSRKNRRRRHLTVSIRAPLRNSKVSQ
jgi:hypothetical protein